MKHIEHKLFSIFNYENEEKWINEKAQNGQILTRVGLCTYEFEDGEAGEYQYRLEVLDEMPTHKKRIEYIKFLEETGIEYMGNMSKLIYLRKKADEGNFDIFSDIDSKINHYKRITGFTNVIAGILIMLEIPALISFIGGNRNKLFLINLIFIVLLISGNKSIQSKIDKLKNDKIYRE